MELSIKMSVVDSVIICLALRSQIRRNAKYAKLALEIHTDASCYIDDIIDEVKAYNAVSTSPFSCDDDFVMSLITSNIK